MIRINGTKVIIRELNKNDVQSLFRNAKNKEVARYITIPHPYKIQDARIFIKKSRQKIKKGLSYELGIELKSINQIIGVISLMEVDYKNRNAEIGCWLGKKFWGRGLAQEAIELMLDFAFNNLKLKRVWAKVVHPNKRSQILLRKAGFKYEGRLRKNTFRNGKWMDDLRFALLKEDWGKNN
jgi:RimJ/RimL family protein N-acetyltransferase